MLKNIKPGDITETKDSIFIWLDILGFSEALEDEEYQKLQEKLFDFRASFSYGNYMSEIISDGIIIQIKEKNVYGLCKILSEIAKKQFEFICKHKYFIRGSIDVGTKMNESDDDNSTGFIGTGLSRAYKMEEKHISWPIIGTTKNGLKALRKYCGIPESGENFNLIQGFNEKGEDIYFIDFLKDISREYYNILSDKVKEFQGKPKIQNKYIWLLRYYHHKFNADALDSALLEVVL